MNRLLLKILKSVVAVACLGGALSAAAADTGGPIRIVVPFGAGGTTDLLARLLAEGLHHELNQQVIVDNKPGAGGTIAASVVAHAPADGTTLLLGTPGTQVTNKYLMAKLPYDPARDFTPVIHVADAAGVIMANPKAGLHSIPDLIRAARARPGQLSWASPGLGSTGHLMIELFQQLSGTRFNHVPYKSGAQVSTDLLAGVVDLGTDNIPTALPHIQAGKLVALGVTGTVPEAALPHTDPVAKHLPGFNMVSWFVLMAPAATPPAVVAQLNQAAQRILKQTETAEKLKGMGARPIGGSPQAVSDLIRSEDVKLKALIEKAGITPQ
jgi:tripartite-type tricarboxylate transporter receptor subunit TctC